MNKSGNRDTKERILDAAEALFARDGYHATTTRAITGTAGVNLASVNYHFGSKTALLDAVFERRLAPLNEARLRMLAGVMEGAAKTGKRPAVRDIMRAFIEPTIRFRDSAPGARDFILLVARSLAEPSDTVRKGFLRFMEPVIKAMLSSLAHAMPGLSGDVILRRFHYAVGVLAHTLRVCDEKTLPKNLRLPCSLGTDDLSREVVEFVTAGMAAP